MFLPLLYNRISGGAASDKNIKENVCAQIEKNFARAKWKVSPFVLYSRKLLITKFNSSCAVLDQETVVVLRKSSESWCSLSKFSGYSAVFELSLFSLLLQKAVRVTTIMKRLRAPESSESRATTPAAAAPADAAAPPAAADPSATSSAPEGAPAAVTELPAGAEISQPAPEAGAEAAASAAEPQQPSPAPQEPEPTSRCNGEASAALHAATEGGDEQG